MFAILTNTKGEKILVNLNLVQTVNRLSDKTALHFGKDEDYILVLESLDYIYDLGRWYRRD